MLGFHPDYGVGYGRVSTKRQTANFGNGLATQKRDTKASAEKFGVPIGPWFEEVGSSLEFSTRKRPILWKAVETALLEDRPLVVADLSRLSRDEDLIKGIFDLGIAVFAVDLGRFPSLSEALKITRRNLKTHKTKNKGLQLSIARRRKAGIPLGNPKMASIAPKGTKANEEKAWNFREKLKPHVRSALQSMRDDGYRKVIWRELASRLNASGHLSIRANAWTGSTIASTVKAMLTRSRDARLADGD
jgi:DNA invertase Pin-like site-specific DNA recombinase